MDRYYTGIGSRSTPPNVLGVMILSGIHLASEGYTLRSGGAVGADTCFEAGAYTGSGSFEIYYPNRYETPSGKPRSPIKYNHYDDVVIYQKAVKIAKEHHPRWQFLNEPTKKLMIRNVFAVLGQDMETPSKFIICWTPDGKASGGTGHTIRVANSFNIPTRNLQNPEVFQNVLSWLNNKSVADILQ